MWREFSRSTLQCGEDVETSRICEPYSTDRVTDEPLCDNNVMQERAFNDASGKIIEEHPCVRE